MLLYGIAFLAGIVTAISPCAYPVLPIVFAGGASGGRRRPYAIVAGLAATFFASLLFLTWLLDQLHIRQDRLRDVSIGLLFVVAATLVVPRLGQVLERPFARLSRRPAGDLGGGFVLGASLGIVFVPCAGPTVTAIAAQSASVAGVKRVGLALVFVLGVAVVLLLIALGARRGSERLSAFRAHVGRLRLALGVVIAAAALLIAFDVDRKLQTKIGDYTGALQSLIGEKSCDTRTQLGQRCLSSSSAGANAGSSSRDYGPAPAFTGISDWINSKPLTTTGLRGKVVLVDFWTYSCINCLRTLPHLEAWDAAYRKAGLVIVGVHTPEFGFEHVVSNVRAATKDLGVRYPVAVDNDYKTWDAYRNGAWPTEYLIDRRGRIREIKEGEGDYDGTERMIRRLLGEPARAQLASVKDTTPTHPTTPESYLGWQRLDRYAGSQIVPDRLVLYRFPLVLPQDTLAYEGFWRVERQRIVAGPRRARLRLHFYAQDVHLVLGGSGRLQVLVDGKRVKTIRVGGLSRLYTLLRYPSVHEGVLELRFTRGISAYAFTFG
jgi:cytochrome c biogenesis protein CcdA/thiol-disulfide isomerase/thioredoxin